MFFWRGSTASLLHPLLSLQLQILSSVALLDCSADKNIDSKVSTNVAVSSDGTCIWIPPGLFESSCFIDITWFPYDDQVCHLKFGSWTYNGFQLDLRLRQKGVDLSNYVVNGEWSLIGIRFLPGLIVCVVL